MINNRIIGSALCKYWHIGAEATLFPQGRTRLPGAARNRGANGLNNPQFFKSRGWEHLCAVAMSSWGRT